VKHQPPVGGTANPSARGMSLEDAFATDNGSPAVSLRGKV
jgi:hypothetical protein